MNLDVFVMNGYGIYVWSAFALTFLVCLALFVRTKKTLKKLEKEFLYEIESLSEEKARTLKTKKIPREIIVSQSKIH